LYYSFWPEDGKVMWYKLLQIFCITAIIWSFLILAKKAANGTLFERFMIIIFGSAIVLLGAYPLSREYGGVMNYVSHTLTRLSSYIDSSEVSSSSKRGRLDAPRTDDTRKTRSETSSIRKDTSNSKPLDDLSTDDRRELDSLIQSVIN
jgi:hypothetical protein